LWQTVWAWKTISYQLPWPSAWAFRNRLDFLLAASASRPPRCNIYSNSMKLYWFRRKSK
jgi:hypothetical protein